MIEIPLRSRDGAVYAHAVVDDIDSEQAQFYWHALRNKFGRIVSVTRRIYNPADKSFTAVVLARVITDAPKGMQVDHVDGDPLNNRRDNLRIVTCAQNLQNQTSRGGTSQYRGVWYSPTKRKWVAGVHVKHLPRWVRHFDTEAEAAEAVSAYRLAHLTHTNEDRAKGPSNG